MLIQPIDQYPNNLEPVVMAPPFTAWPAMPPGAARYHQPRHQTKKPVTARSPAR